MVNKININQFKTKVKKLNKKNIDLIITDFDDTIFCRKEQLDDCELLRNNR
jgi:predicted HAD superfamily phosphohydrolase YqeG